MTEVILSTEQKILYAAEQVFLEKGMDGARMQDIADRAGINKALLHYYFRTKEKMFDAIFVTNFKEFIPVLSNVIENENNLKAAMIKLADVYFELLSTKPYLPLFIISEINRNPTQIEKNLLDKMGLKQIINQLLIKLKKQENFTQDPRQIIISIISAIIFPFLAKQLLTPLIFNNNPFDYQAFMEERKAFITDMIDQLFSNYTK